jgi:hypothetical protein
MLMWGSDWTMSSPVSATDLAERLRLLTQTIDHDRDLHFPKHSTATITDQRFDFVVGPSLGRGRPRLRCSGTFSTTSEETTVHIRLRPCGEMIGYFGLLAVLFGSVMVWGFWPISRTVAVGSVLAIGLLVAILLWLGAWVSVRWVRRQLIEVLSAAKDMGPRGSGPAASRTHLEPH